MGSLLRLLGCHDQRRIFLCSCGKARYGCCRDAQTRQNIPRACKRVFVRVTFLYFLDVPIVGMLVRSEHPRPGDESGTAAQSPFVIAAVCAEINVVPSNINAGVLSSAWLASNQSMLAGTRTMYGLALKSHAPRYSYERPRAVSRACARHCKYQSRPWRISVARMGPIRFSIGFLR